MIGNAFGFPHVLLIIVIWALLLALVGTLLWVVVRLGVRFGMRDHQRWLDARPQPGTDA